jgi:hypothetical protein
VEQDHRAIKRRVRASQGFRAFDSAARTIQGVETVNMISKGQVRWLEKDDIIGQIAFVARLFGLTVVARCRVRTISLAPEFQVCNTSLAREYKLTLPEERVLFRNSQRPGDSYGTARTVTNPDLLKRLGLRDERKADSPSHWKY